MPRHVSGVRTVDRNGVVRAVVDLDGALVTPGLVDAHLHIVGTGLAAPGTGRPARDGVSDTPRDTPTPGRLHPNDEQRCDLRTWP